MILIQLHNCENENAVKNINSFSQTKNVSVGIFVYCVHRGSTFMEFHHVFSVVEITIKMKIKIGKFTSSRSVLH